MFFLQKVYLFVFRPTLSTRSAPGLALFFADRQLSRRMPV